MIVKEQRLRFPDIIRGVCTLMIVISHCGMYLSNDLIAAFWKTATIAIYMFFILSGFCISWNYDDKIIGDGNKRICLKFLKKRFMKLLPTYWIYTGGVLIVDNYFFRFFEKNLVTWHKKDILNICRSLFCFPSGILDGYPSTLIPPGWFLSYILFFYLIYALFHNIKYRNIFFHIWELAILLYNLFWENDIKKIPIVMFLLSVNFLPILIGVEIKKYILLEKGSLEKKSMITAIIWLFLSYIITGFHYDMKYNNKIIIFLYILPFAILFYKVTWLERNGVFNIKNNQLVRILYFINKISYSVFLTHYITLCLIGNTIFFVSLDFLLCIFTGAFCYYLIEKPIKNMTIFLSEREEINIKRKKK